MNMTVSERDRQVEALTRFAHSIGRRIIPAPADETPVQGAWRMRFSALQRFALYYSAGLVQTDQQGTMDRLFEMMHNEERAAHQAMIREKERHTMEYLTGKRTTPPSWGSC